MTYYRHCTVVDEQGNPSGFAMVKVEDNGQVDVSKLRLKLSAPQDLNIVSTPPSVSKPRQEIESPPLFPPPSPIARSTPVTLRGVKRGSSENSEVVGLDVDSKAEYLEQEDNKAENLKQEFEQNRNAKETLTEEEYSRLRKPFDLGWKRNVIISRGCKIKACQYISPSGKICKSHQQIKELLDGEQLQDLIVLGDTRIDLSKSNFSFSGKFLGFAEGKETVSKSSFYTDLIEDRECSETPPPFGKFVLVNKKKKRVLCTHPSCFRRLSTSIKSHNDHVQKAHTEGPKTKKNKADVEKPSVGQRTKNGSVSSQVIPEVSDNSSITINNNIKVKEENDEKDEKEKEEEKEKEKEEEKEREEEQKATFKVRIESRKDNNSREITVKLWKTAKVLKSLKRLKRDGEYETVETVWVCEGRIVEKEETAESLNGKLVTLRTRH